VQQRVEKERAAAGVRIVTPRDLRFEIDPRHVRCWHPAGPLVSHYFNVLSLYFPAGEAFFIDSVRHFERCVHNPATRRDLKGFLGQEGMHRREHERYNAALAAAGLPAAYLAKRVANFFGWIHRFLSAKSRLAVTIGLEHITAILAEPLLRDERILANCDPSVARLWWWHAIEETEHKAVAFDVYVEVTSADRSAYLRRTIAMAAISAAFAASTLVFLLVFARRDALLADRRAWSELRRFLFAQPGPLRGIGRRYLHYFRPHFHPWQLDNAALAAHWAPLILEPRSRPGASAAADQS